METSDDNCFFYELYGCEHKKEKLQNGYQARINTIINCSKQLNDGYHAQLQTLMDSEPVNPCIKVHKSCVSRYTSITNIQAHLDHVRKSCDNDDSEESAPKRLRSTISDRFDFRKHCLFCLDVNPCLLMSEYDPKTPEVRRKRAFLIRSDVKADGQEYKQYILDICQKRNDTLGDTVRERVLGAVGDLHAADARCHESCRASFMSKRNVHHHIGTSRKSTDDLAFSSVCKKMLDVETIVRKHGARLSFLHCM